MIRPAWGPVLALLLGAACVLLPACAETDDELARAREDCRNLCDRVSFCEVPLEGELGEPDPCYATCEDWIDPAQVLRPDPAVIACAEEPDCEALRACIEALSPPL